MVFFRAFAPSVVPDPGLVTDDLGTRWESARVAFKPYACGTMTQPFVDCAIRLAGRGIRADDIAELRCSVGEGTVHRLWEPLELKRRPPSAYAAKFSTPYCIAVGFLRGDAGPWRSSTRSRSVTPKCCHWPGECTTRSIPGTSTLAITPAGSAPRLRTGACSRSFSPIFAAVREILSGALNWRGSARQTLLWPGRTRRLQAS